MQSISHTKTYTLKTTQDAQGVCSQERERERLTHTHTHTHTHTSPQSSLNNTMLSSLTLSAAGVATTTASSSSTASQQQQQQQQSLSIFGSDGLDASDHLLREGAVHQNMIYQDYMTSALSSDAEWKRLKQQMQDNKLTTSSAILRHMRDAAGGSTNLDMSSSHRRRCGSADNLQMGHSLRHRNNNNSNTHGEATINLASVFKSEDDVEQDKRIAQRESAAQQRKMMQRWDDNNNNNTTTESPSTSTMSLQDKSAFPDTPSTVTTDSTTSPSLDKTTTRMMNDVPSTVNNTVDSDSDDEGHSPGELLCDFGRRPPKAPRRRSQSTIVLPTNRTNSGLSALTNSSSSSNSSNTSPAPSHSWFERWMTSTGATPTVSPFQDGTETPRDPSLDLDAPKDSDNGTNTTTTTTRSPFSRMLGSWRAPREEPRSLVGRPSSTVMTPTMTKPLPLNRRSSTTDLPPSSTKRSPFLSAFSTERQLPRELELSNHDHPPSSSPSPPPPTGTTSTKQLKSRRKKSSTALALSRNKSKTRTNKASDQPDDIDAYSPSLERKMERSNTNDSSDDDVCQTAVLPASSTVSSSRRTSYSRCESERWQLNSNSPKRGTTNRRTSKSPRRPIARKPSRQSKRGSTNGLPLPAKQYFPDDLLGSFSDIQIGKKKKNTNNNSNSSSGTRNNNSNNNNERSETHETELDSEDECSVVPW